MNEDAERITILAEEFTAAALEFHRGRMYEKGYVLEGTINKRQFQIIEGVESPKTLFDGKALFAVTFIKRQND